jgi:hypothetical protein
MRRIAIILAAAAACVLASAGDSCRSRDTAEPAERGLPHQLPGITPFLATSPTAAAPIQRRDPVRTWATMRALGLVPCELTRLRSLP